MPKGGATTGSQVIAMRERAVIAWAYFATASKHLCAFAMNAAAGMTMQVGRVMILVLTGD